jgi:HlyD family secretion protein
VTTGANGLALAALLVLAAAGMVAALVVRVPQLVHGAGILLLPAGMMDVSVETGGRIVAVDVQVGQLIHKGQMVARIDQPELENALAQAQAGALDAATARRLTADAQAQARRMREQIAAEKRQGLQRALSLANERLAAFKDRAVILANLAKDTFVLKQTLVDARIRIGDTEQEVAELQRSQTQIDADLGNAAIVDAQALLSLDLRAGETARQVGAARRRLAGAETVVSPYDGRVVELKHDAGELVQGGAALLALMPIAGHDQADPLRLVLYVPGGDGKKIAPGMKAQISPSTARREEFGFILGRVVSVAAAPATEDGMMRTVKNHQLVAELSRQGAPFEVTVALDTDAQHPGGYRWSFSHGPSGTLGAGTLADGAVQIQEVRLAELVFPALHQIAWHRP